MSRTDLGNSEPNTNTELPVVTIVIPCHNHQDLVVRAINSVVSQDYPRKIIAVINDGSSDNSLDIIKNNLTNISSIKDDTVWQAEWQQTKVPVVLIHNENPSGPSAARNKGIKGLWNNTHLYCMLDADDYYLPTKISKCVEKFLEDPINTGIVYHDLLINNIANNTMLYEYREPFDRQRLEQECIISNTPLINKMAFQQCGMYDEEMRTCEDWDLWLRITEKFAAIHIAEPLSAYSVTGYNATDIISKPVWQQNWQRVRAKLEQRKNVRSS